MTFSNKVSKPLVRLSWCLLILTLIPSCLKQKDDVTPVTPVDPNMPEQEITYNWPHIADSAQQSLKLFYKSDSKIYTASNQSYQWAQYWPSAHVLDVLVDGYLRTGSNSFITMMDDLLIGMKARNGGTWINHFYDDMEWMALAGLRAYQATNDSKYKDIFDVLWIDIKNGWSDDLGGGIWWNKDKTSKNSISNSPAAIFAARRYNLFKDESDLIFAEKIYSWEKSKFYNPNGSIYDNIDKDGTVQTSPGWIFTYNEGTFLAAALELYKITKNQVYLNDAISAANYTIGSLTVNGILKSEGEGDGGLFKGIFIRYLTRLIIDGPLDTNKKDEYALFLKKNAETLWSKGTNKQQVLFGPDWIKIPGNKTDLTTQLSGIMLIEATADLYKKNYLK